MAVDKIKEKQQNELVLLHEIFREDIKDLGSEMELGAPGKLLLSLYSLETNGTRKHTLYVQIKIICPFDYPISIPKITFTKSNGLNSEELNKLKKSIHKLSLKLKGEIMLLDLAMHVQGYLYNIQKTQAPLQPEETHVKNIHGYITQCSYKDREMNQTQYKSFYHEMISNQKNKVIELENDRLKKYETLQTWRKLQLIAVEKEMMKKKKYQSALSQNPQNRDIKKVNFQQENYYQDSMLNDNLIQNKSIIEKHQHNGNFAMPFIGTHVVCNKIIGQSEIHTTFMCNVDGKEEKFLMKEYNLPLIKNENNAEFQTLHHSLKNMAKIWAFTCAFQHPTLVPYVQLISDINPSTDANQLKQSPLVPHDTQLLKFAFTREFIFGTPLIDKLKTPFSLDWFSFQNYIYQLTSAFAYLQNQSPNHKLPFNFEPADLYLDNRGSLKITNFGLDKELKRTFRTGRDWLAKIKDGGDAKETFTNEFTPFTNFDVSQNEISPLHLGKIVVTLLSQCHASNLSQLCDQQPLEQPELSIINGKLLNDHELPSKLRGELKDFIEVCLHQTDPYNPFAVSNLFEHPFLRPVFLKDQALLHDQVRLPNFPLAIKEDIVQVAQPKADTIALEPSKPFESNKPTLRQRTVSPQPVTSSHSRLLQDFQMLEWIGQGGFGDVIKVRNELDDRVYAIKRIPIAEKSLAYRKFNRKITREIKLLSSLNHEHIVRYYNSWFETFDEASLDQFKGLYGMSSPNGAPLNAGSTDSPNQGVPSKKCEDLSAHIRARAAFGKMNDPFFANGQTCGFSQSLSKGNLAQPDTPFTYSYFHYFSSDSGENDSFSSSSTTSTSSGDYEACPPCPKPIDISAGASVIFAHESGECTVQQDTNQEEATLNEGNNVVKGDTSSEMASYLPRRYVCIQMEFCENNTLRKAIDDSRLYEQPQRAWRYFRETIEGLVYLHEQGIVHRDLKPVNIFLDVKDHIKIGDFGLATTQMFGKDIMFEDVNEKISVKEQIARKSMDENFLYLSTKVGTELYVAPEIWFSDGKSAFKYNQKVDMYSLGIIFFEIWFPPAPTTMERYQVLINLRHPSINIPQTFEENYPNQSEILRWLLAHDPDNRPTSKELLMSGHLPPLELEEIELDTVIARAINNPLSFPYRKIVTSLFNQALPSPTADYAFDVVDTTKKNQTIQSASNKDFALVNAQDPLSYLRTGRAREAHQNLMQLLASRVFEKHGAHQLALPLLTPPCAALKEMLPTAGIPLIERSGGLVTLPTDYRISLARHFAHNNILCLNRYGFDKVYKESKLIYTHPKECWEINFDLISPASRFSSLLDAEAIYSVQQIIELFPSLKERQYCLQLNHVSLILAVFSHLNISTHHYAQVMDIVVAAERKIRSLKVAANQKLLAEIRRVSIYKIQESCGLSSDVITEFFDIIDVEENSFPCFAQGLSAKLKGKKGSRVYYLLDRGIQEIGATVNYLKILDFDLPVSYGLKGGLLANASYKYCSGVIFIFINPPPHLTKKVDKKCMGNTCASSFPSLDILARGGRYDKLIRTFQFAVALNTPREMVGVNGKGKDFTVQAIWDDPQEYNFTNCPHGVGLTLSYETILGAYKTGECVKERSVDSQRRDTLFDYIVLLVKGQNTEIDLRSVENDPFKMPGPAKEKVKRKKRRRPQRPKSTVKDDVGTTKAFCYDKILLPLLAHLMKILWDQRQTLNIQYLEIENSDDLDELCIKLGGVCKYFLAFSPDYCTDLEGPLPQIPLDDVPFLMRSCTELYVEKLINLFDLTEECKSSTLKDYACRRTSLSRSFQDISGSNLSLNTNSRHGGYLSRTNSTFNGAPPEHSLVYNERGKESLEEIGNVANTVCQHCLHDPIGCSGSSSGYKNAISISSFAAVVNVSFITGEKLSAFMKRKYETQIISKLYETSPLASTIPATVKSHKTSVEVIAVELSSAVIKTFCAFYDLNPNSTVPTSQNDLSNVATCHKTPILHKLDPADLTFVYEKYPKSRKPLSQIVEHLQKLKCLNKTPFFCVVYSYKDNFYKII